MELKELKAKAYDILATIQSLQANLQEVNQQIAEKMQQEDKPKKEK